MTKIVAFGIFFLLLRLVSNIGFTWPSTLFLSPMMESSMSLSSLLNTAPCHTGAADPRRATVARVLVDPLRLVAARSPPGLGSTKTHWHSQQRRKVAQQCRRIATEVREVLALYRLDLDRVRSLWRGLEQNTVQLDVFSNVFRRVGTSI